MKRDADYIRQLLLEFEAADKWLVIHAPTLSMDEEEERRGYHIYLMCDQGLLIPVGDSTYRMTAYAHDVVDAVRDQSVWATAK